MAFTNTRRPRTVALPGPQDVIRTVINWMETRSKRKEVVSLIQQEDWVLKDMGITRGDVYEALASSGDPSLNLRVLAAKRRFWTRSRTQI